MLRTSTVGSDDRPHAVEDLREHSLPLHGAKDLDHFIERVGNAHYVPLGEASHRTHEYYAWRSRISRRLIQEKGFSFIAVEGDWPDCYRLLVDTRPIGHRAIGVVYHPDHERQGNYVPSVIPKWYEAFLLLDRTRALHPLHIRSDGHLMPETYPWGE